jgi:hypothetical protein
VRIIVPTFSSHKTHEVYIYCSKRGWYRLGTDRTENSLFPILLRTSVYCLDSKQPATLFPLCDFIGPPRCLATRNNTRNPMVAYVYSVARSVA